MRSLRGVTALMVALLFQLSLVGSAYACEPHTGREQGLREHAVMAGANAAMPMSTSDHRMGPVAPSSSCDGSSGQMPCGIPSGGASCASMLACGSTLPSVASNAVLFAPQTALRIAAGATREPPTRTYPPEPPPPRA